MNLTVSLLPDDIPDLYCIYFDKLLEAMNDKTLYQQAVSLALLAPGLQYLKCFGEKVCAVEILLVVSFYHPMLRFC
jgi:hypothetical protein